MFLGKEWLLRSNGRSVDFWLDDWLGLGPLYSLFPSIFKVVTNKESSANECYEGERVL